MKLRTWRKYHKWLGLTCCFFLLMFSFSGIILNHRTCFAKYNMNRKGILSGYQYQHWNGGLLRGTVFYKGHILLYGYNGIWQTDSQASFFKDANKGLPDGADYRQIKTLAKTKDGRLYALSQFALYRFAERTSEWKPVSFSGTQNELLSDVCSHGDTVIVVSRSNLYLSTAADKPFKKIQLLQPAHYDGKVSLFHFVWLLHSGAMFGLPGKLIMDTVAVILIILSLTGIVYWLLPKYIRRERQNHKQAKTSTRILKLSLHYHDKLGRTTIILTLLIAITGWCLRPPLLIPLVSSKTKPIPYTTLDSPNAWHDKLRMLRYDKSYGDWLLSTSEGFYSLKDFNSVPQKLHQTPDAGPMGLNVWIQDSTGKWLCGSSNGLFTWKRKNGSVIDYFTHQPLLHKKKSHFSEHSISGYSADFKSGPFAVDYNQGTKAFDQPKRFDTLPMSLWNVALEVHTGRIYMGSYATLFFVFFAGLIIVSCLWSGYKIRIKKKNHPLKTVPSS
jgi:hypothetical protein